MAQRKKAKTKKAMKQSINHLYDALMQEKEKHRRASKIIGQLKQENEANNYWTRILTNKVKKLSQKLDELKNNNETALDISANLIKRITLG